MTVVRAGLPIQVSATGQVTGQNTVLQSIICTTTGAFTLYDTNTGTTTNLVLPSFSLTAPSSFAVDMRFKNGIYVVTTTGVFTFIVS